MDFVNWLSENDLILVGAVFVGVIAAVAMVVMLIAPAEKEEEDADLQPRAQGFGRSKNSADLYSGHEDWDDLLAERNQSAKYLLPTEAKERKKLGDRLMHAGLYRKNSVLVFSVLKLVLAGVAILFGFSASSAGLMDARSGLMAGIAAAVFGTIAPSFWLDRCKNQRQLQIRRALPDALDIIIICVEAGLSLPAAFQKVSVELGLAHPLLAAEFVIVQREIQMGCSTGEAFRRFSGRFDMEELRTLSAVILQTEKFGASIVKALQVHGETLRTRRLFMAEEKAQKAVVFLLIPTALFIFPALFVVVLGPAAFDIAEALNKF